MCNDYGDYVDYADYLAAFSQTHIPVKWPDAIPNLPPRDDIWPTDKGPVIRRLEDGANGSPNSVGASAGSTKTPTDHQFPLRRPELSGRSPSGARLILLRVHRYEITGVKVEIHQGRRGLVLLRRPMASDAMPQGDEALTLLTTEPGPDIAPIHDRPGAP
jgi:putative SOS response-associated peptidase YedK